MSGTWLLIGVAVLAVALVAALIFTLFKRD